MGSMSVCQPESWLYEIWQKGQDRPCYVMVPNANDLVKSHLMIAVREEVEVLKEKIAELMDRINQLELENTILKANVSQETLSQLTATIQTASTNPSPQTTVTTTTTTGQQQQQPSSQTVQKPPSQNTNTSNGSVS